jgi:hypothetical protein
VACRWLGRHRTQPAGFDLVASATITAAPGTIFRPALSGFGLPCLFPRLYLATPPVEKLPVPDFRTVGSEEVQHKTICEVGFVLVGSHASSQWRPKFHRQQHGMLIESRIFLPILSQSADDGLNAA